MCGATLKYISYRQLRVWRYSLHDIVRRYSLQFPSGVWRYSFATVSVPPNPLNFVCGATVSYRQLRVHAKVLD